LYYKPISIVNDDSGIVNELETSLIGDARVVIYDRHMFTVQATGVLVHGSPFKPSLLRPGACTKVELLKSASLRWVLVLLASNRLGWKGLPWTNTPACYKHS